MTTRGRYLRLHMCIDNRRALAQRRGCGAAREFPMTVPAAAVLCASAFIQQSALSQKPRQNANYLQQWSSSWAKWHPRGRFYAWSGDFVI